MGVKGMPWLYDIAFTRGDPKMTRIIFWRAGTLWCRLPPLGEYSRNPSVSVYQLVLLWEAAFGFSELFLKTLSTHFCPFHDGCKCTCPHHAEYSLVFDQKWHDPCAPPQYSPNVTPKDYFFCFPGWKKSSKGIILLIWKRWNKKQQKH